MTSNDTQDDPSRSPHWVGDYENEFGGVVPVMENARMFTEDEVEAVTAGDDDTGTQLYAWFSAGRLAAAQVHQSARSTLPTADRSEARIFLEDDPEDQAGNEFLEYNEVVIEDLPTDDMTPSEGGMPSDVATLEDELVEQDDKSLVNYQTGTESEERRENHKMDQTVIHPTKVTAPQPGAAGPPMEQSLLDPQEAATSKLSAKDPPVNHRSMERVAAVTRTPGADDPSTAFVPHTLGDCGNRVPRFASVAALLTPDGSNFSAIRLTTNSNPSFVACGENLSIPEEVYSNGTPWTISQEVPHLSSNPNGAGPHREKVNNIATPKFTVRFSRTPHDRTSIHMRDTTDDDVFLGQEYRGSTHPGNVRFRRLIQENKDEWKSFHNIHRRKTKLSGSILKQIKVVFSRRRITVSGIV